MSNLALLTSLGSITLSLNPNTDDTGDTCDDDDSNESTPYDVANTDSPSCEQQLAASREQILFFMDAPVVSLTSSNGRVSGKSWKSQKCATVRSRLSEGVKTKNWDDRMQRTQRALAIKKLEAELKEEKQAEIQRRRQITQERKKAAEERQRLEEDKAKMGARKAARLRRKAGRTKKING